MYYKQGKETSSESWGRGGGQGALEFVVRSCLCASMVPDQPGLKRPQLGFNSGPPSLFVERPRLLNFIFHASLILDYKDLTTIQHLSHSPSLPFPHPHLPPLHLLLPLLHR
jgi:hypothetical protein